MNFVQFKQHLALIPAIVLALGSPHNVAMSAAGGSGTVFVDANSGSDSTGDGSASNPWKSISYATAQSGVTAVQAASGTYDEANGESFPITLPSGRSYSLVGPSDGSAVVTHTTATGSPYVFYATMGGGPNSTDTISLQNLTINPATNDRALRVNDGMHIDLFNNTVIGGYQAFDLRMNADSGTVSIQSNTLSGQSGNGIELATDDSPTNWTILIDGNTITGAGNDAMRISAEAEEDSEMLSGEIIVSNNTITGPKNEGIEIVVTCSEELAPIDVDVTLSGNTVSGAGWDGIEVSYSQSDGSTVIAPGIFDLAVANNQVTGSTDDNIWINLFIDNPADITAEMIFLNNTSTAAGDDAIDFSISMNDDSQALDLTVGITYNDLTGAQSDGLELGFEADSGPPVDFTFDLICDNNSITGHFDEGIDVTAFSQENTSAMGGSAVASLSISENLITGNTSHGVIFDFDIWSNSSSVTGNYSIDMKGNTLSAPAGMYDIKVETTPAFVLPTITATQNFWGTESSSVIAGRVYDGVDSAGKSIVDHTSPLPDALNFTASVDNSTGTPYCQIDAANDGTFFTYAAGSTVMTVTIDGVPATVAFTVGNNQILCLFPGAIVDGADVCVTNPGGQTGCSTLDADTTNTPPFAAYDATTTPNGTAVVVDLIANDTDAEGNIDPSSIAIVRVPGQGNVVVNGDGTVTYTPNPGPDTTDTFNYTVSDTGGLTSNVATVQVQTTGGNNNIPTAVYDAASTGFETPVSISLLDNDFDVDGDALVPSSVIIERNPHAGTVTVVDGVATYTPNPLASGRTDTFTYSVADARGGRSNIATVEVNVGSSGVR